MGRFMDKYLGTRYPEEGVTPRHIQEVRAALLALNGTDVPFVLRHGVGKEGDLVAECRVPGLRVRLWTRMRLDAAKREVRALDEQWEGSFAEHTRGQRSSGPANAVYWVYEKQKGSDGRERRVQTVRFETSQIKNPLRQTVLDAGWTWRGVLFRL
ncbi:hypothetical protein [Streptomyces sp. NBC_00539]|uniref:hypothetical protein n=1 Tax=Streptomyces sp. NBC_00539 TaxID=2975770 RepID=UPI002E7FE086|nr:hypothetical protein [Streptomyces sp. NBC_00539]WUC69212.1 hypothetical protein OG861_33790 [Streptomyces sp. NBC_00539]